VALEGLGAVETEVETMSPISSHLRIWLGGMLLLPIALAVGAISASAASVLVTFDADPLGNIPGNEFTSADSSEIHFSDTQIAFPSGNEMFILNAPFTNGSNALGVGFDDDDSALRIALDFQATEIGMDFFFGDVFLPQMDDEAVLTAYLNGVEVGQISKSLFLILPQDRSIVFKGAAFDAVEFKFDVSSPGGLTEIVDNVAVNAIPEPRAAIAFATGALVIGAACRRRSRAAVGVHAGRR
jgi:hypothetical protein